MLEGLFEEETHHQTSSTVRRDIKVPPSPRKIHGLCGIFNQGATCFLNSLLQTLVMTPELREALFGVSEEHLGCSANGDKSNGKVRIIPLELRRLFTRLLLLNAECVGTEALTTSFGWTDADVGTQHDVQELNRILFSAIKDSLVGTVGKNIIKDLYHGVIVNQIICESCGRCSEREEEFLDMCVSVSGYSSLQESLSSAYNNPEHLSGDNKYNCDGCKKLVNATKVIRVFDIPLVCAWFRTGQLSLVIVRGDYTGQPGAKLRRLPPILTLSLLRFSFDYVKLERFKETSKFAFPENIDMGVYCDEEQPPEMTEYELFSVVIHRGSTHGGHYHCYIRDVDGLGNWTNPGEDEIQLPVDPSTGKVDYIEFDSPLELLQAIIAKSPEKCLPVDKLCSEMANQTGVSWNKRFKGKYGQISKFIKRHDDKFVFDPATALVELKSYTGGQRTEAKESNDKHGANSTKSADRGRGDQRERPSSPLPEPGYCWFDYNDNRIQSIRASEIEKQFSGKESAYMLFYRRKSLRRPYDAYNNPLYQIPESLVNEILEENDKLEQSRRDYEIRVNSITLVVNLGQFYSPARGALEPISPSCSSIQVMIDRRCNVQELSEAIKRDAGELMMSDFVIHTAKQLPAGLHLYDNISEYLDKTLIECGLIHEDNLFVWDGKQVNGENIVTGLQNEPIFLNVSCVESGETLSHGFNKSMTASTVISVMTGEDTPGKYQLSRNINSNNREQMVPFNQEDLTKPLCELYLKDADTLLIQKVVEQNYETLYAQRKTAFKQEELIDLVVELRCQECGSDGFYPVVSLQVEPDMPISALKSNVMKQASIKTLKDGGRLRIDHPNMGLRPPIRDKEGVADAGLKNGTRLVLEDGPAPKTNQISISHSLQGQTQEMIVDKNITVWVLCQWIGKARGLSDDNWHLRQTNMFHEATSLLDDSASLEQCNVRDGDLLLIEEGKLVPKGYLKFRAQLLPYLVPENSSRVLSWISDAVTALFSKQTVRDSSQTSLDLGEVIISQLATIDDLKQQLMTLPSLMELQVPSTSFLRVRMLRDNQLATVLKPGSMSLQRLKIKGDSYLAAQVLPYPEELGGNHLILQIAERVIATRSYKPARELIWSTKGHASPKDLRQAVADLICLPVEHLSIYKHVPHKHEWTVISETAQKAKNPDKTKGQKGQKTNVKNPPYSIQDGDLIGVKNMQLDPHNTDDMSTKDDELGRHQLAVEAKNKRKEREELRSNNAANNDAEKYKPRTRREEKTIRIHVDSFE